jgi:hypothetical protein
VLLVPLMSTQNPSGHIFFQTPKGIFLPFDDAYSIRVWGIFRRGDPMASGLGKFYIQYIQAEQVMVLDSAPTQ